MPKKFHIVDLVLAVAAALCLFMIVFGGFFVFELRNNKELGYKIYCIDGVEYLYVEEFGGLAPHLKPDGALYTCGGEEQEGQKAGGQG